MTLDEKITKAAQPLLNPGEAIEVCTMCTFGKVSIGKKELAAAVLMAIVTGGALTIVSAPKMVHLVLTNRRLLVLGQDFTGNPKSAVAMELPRADVRAAPAKGSVLWLTYEMTDKAGTAFAQMRFALPNRRSGRQIAIALGAPVA